jgi:hypothetical protein
MSAEYLLAIALALAIGMGIWISKREFYELRDFSPRVALAELTDLVRETRTSLEIVSDMAPSIYGDATLVSEVRAALHRGVVIRILYYPCKRSRKTARLFEKMSEAHGPGSIVIKELSDPWPYHFWVSDRRHVRLEYPHRLCDVSDLRGHLIYNSLRVGNRLARFFDYLWSES